MPCPVCGHSCDERQETIVEYLETEADKYLGYELREQAYALKNAAREIRDGAHHKGER